jgi:hypothetical protein
MPDSRGVPNASERSESPMLRSFPAPNAAVDTPTLPAIAD